MSYPRRPIPGVARVAGRVRALPSVCLTILLCAALVSAGGCERPAAAKLAPKCYLAQDGANWRILDDRYTPKGAGGPPGGIVLVEDVVGVAARGKYVIGQTGSDRWFLIDLRDLGAGETANATVSWFTTLADWDAACHQAGIADRTLVAPPEVVK